MAATAESSKLHNERTKLESDIREKQRLQMESSSEVKRLELDMIASRESIKALELKIGHT